jgi:hypothetical protein
LKRNAKKTCSPTAEEHLNGVCEIKKEGTTARLKTKNPIPGRDLDAVLIVQVLKNKISH